MRFLMAKAAQEGRGIGLACQEESTVSIGPAMDLLTTSDRGTKAWAFDRSIMARSPRLKTRPSICGNFAGRLKRKPPRSNRSESSEALVGRRSTTAGTMVTLDNVSQPLERFACLHMKMARSRICLTRMA